MYFDGIKVGDLVYFVNDPKGYPVDEMFSEYFKADNWEIQFDGVLNGAFLRNFGQIVFWQPVHIDPPPRPKKLISKEIAFDACCHCKTDESIGASHQHVQWSIPKDAINIKCTYEVEE